MAQKTLREFAKEYAKGTLSKEAYRKSRADLLEGILAGEIPVWVNTYPAPIVFHGSGEKREITQRRGRRNRADGSGDEQNEITRIVTEPDEVSDSFPSAPRAVPIPPAPAAPVSRPVPMAGMIAGVVLVALAAVAYLAARPGETPAPGAGSAQSAATEVPSATASARAPADRAAPDLIKRFLEQKNWTDAGMDAFLSEWQSLSAEQRASAAGSMEMSQLANTIYKKLLEERALSGLGTGEQGMAKQRRLIAFAGEIGIQDPRLTVPNAPASGARSSGPKPAEQEVDSAPPDGTGGIIDAATGTAVEYRDAVADTGARHAT